jgi:DnaD/phage-associated family protein
LSRFEKLGFLTVETTKQNSLVTIVNWDKYQGSDTDNNQQTNIHLTNNQPTPNQHLTTNKECNNYNNNKNDNNTAVRAAAASAVNHYIQNINPTASPMEVEKLAIWVKELDRESKGNDVVICAINDAVMCNHRSLKYIDKILDRCKKQGIYTAEAFAAQKEVFMSQKKKSTGIKVNTFTNYEQRQYDDDELERLLAEKEKRWMEGD